MSQFSHHLRPPLPLTLIMFGRALICPVWREQPQGQLYLGDSVFAKVLGKKIGTKLSTDAEIPRLQRRASAPVRLVAMPARDPANRQAYATGCFSMKEIAHAFNIHMRP